MLYREKKSFNELKIKCRTEMKKSSDLIGFRSLTLVLVFFLSSRLSYLVCRLLYRVLNKVLEVWLSLTDQWSTQDWVLGRLYALSQPSIQRHLWTNFWKAMNPMWLLLDNYFVQHNGSLHQQMQFFATADGDHRPRDQRHQVSLSRSYMKNNTFVNH